MNKNKKTEMLSNTSNEVENEPELILESEEKGFKVFRCSRCGEIIYTESSTMPKCPHCNMVKLKFMGESNNPVEESWF